jgi:CheY-like chemotaxis protein
MCAAESIDRRPTLLLVDDSGVQRDLYEVALDSEFRVMTATGGADAVAMARSMRPDVVVLDVRMPLMDGWETCSRLKGYPGTAGIPVILLTAADEPDLPRHATAVGAAALVRKPCSPRALRDTIFAALEASTA